MEIMKIWSDHVDVVHESGVVGVVGVCCYKGDVCLLEGTLPSWWWPGMDTPAFRITPVSMSLLSVGFVYANEEARVKGE